MLPFLISVGSPAFRRWMAERLPVKNVQAARGIADLMEQTSREILASKRKALSEGDEAVHRQIGAGKDIMSVLCRLS